MVNDPVCPAVRVRVLAAEEDGVKLETPTENSHSVGTLGGVTADEVEVA